MAKRSRSSPTSRRFQRSAARLGVDMNTLEVPRLRFIRLVYISQSTIFWKRSVFFIYHPSKRKPHFWMVGWLCGGIQLLWNGLLVCFTICFTVCTQNPHPPMGCCPCCLLPPHPSGALKLKALRHSYTPCFVGIYTTPTSSDPGRRSLQILRN